MSCWSYPPPPQQPAHRRFAWWWLLPGGLVGLVATPGISYLGILLDPQLRSGWTTLCLLILPFGPLVLGALLAAVPGAPARRGFGLGLILGWAPASIVAAGVCLFATQIGEQVAIPPPVGP